MKLSLTVTTQPLLNGKSVARIEGPDIGGEGWEEARESGPTEEEALGSARTLILKRLASSPEGKLLSEMKVRHLRRRPEVPAEEALQREALTVKALEEWVRWVRGANQVNPSEESSYINFPGPSLEGSRAWLNGKPFWISYHLSSGNPLLIIELRWSCGFQESLTREDVDAVTACLRAEGVGVLKGWASNQNAPAYSFLLNLPSPAVVQGAPPTLPPPWHR